MQQGGMRCVVIRNSIRVVMDLPKTQCHGHIQSASTTRSWGLDAKQGQNQSMLLILRTLAVQYLRLGMGGTAIEQGGHDVCVPLLTSDEQRRCSICLQDATAGECGALSFGNNGSHGGATHNPVSWTHPERHRKLGHGR